MPRKRPILKATDVGPILNGAPMSVDLMRRVCDTFTRLTHTRIVCLDGPRTKKVRVRRTRRHIFLVLNNEDRWICCVNDGKTTLTQYNTDETTDSTDLSTCLLKAYNLQPFGLKQTIVKSSVPRPSSDADSGFVSIAVAALVAASVKKITVPASMDAAAARQNLLRVMYRGKMNGFPNYKESGGCCGKKRTDELLFIGLFEAFRALGQKTASPPPSPLVDDPPSPIPIVTQPRTPSPPLRRLPRPSSQVEITEIEEDEVPEARVNLDQEMEGALGLPDIPVDGRRVVKYEKGPTSSALSVATAGILEDRNIRFIQYERITKEVHYIKPKSNRSNKSNE